MKQWWEKTIESTNEYKQVLMGLPYPLNKQLLSGDFDTDQTMSHTITTDTLRVPYFPDLAGVWAIETRAGRFMFWQYNHFVESGFNLHAMYPDHEQNANYKSIHGSGKTSVEKFVTWYDGNVACVNLTGMLMRDEPPSSLFGQSCITYLQLTDVLNELSVTDAAQKIVLKISSMGGNTLGAFPCASSIAKANKIKPITAFVNDNCCSAAYLLASQCNEIIAAESSLVGSIGVVTVLVDDSEATEKLGIKRVVVASSEKKGRGLDGKVTKPLVDDLQNKIMETHESFRLKVMEGRKMTESEIDAVSDGDVHYSDKALKLKLIDRVANFDDLFNIGTESDKPTSNRRPNNKTGGTNEMTDQEMKEMQEKNAQLEADLKQAQADAEASRTAAAEALAKSAEDVVVETTTTTVTEESVADIARKASAEEMKPMEDQLASEREKREALESQIEEINKVRAQEEKAFRTKLCSNWVDKKVAEHHILPKDSNAIKVLLNMLIGPNSNMEMEYVDNDGTTQKLSGQLYEIAINILGGAFASRMNFTEMSHSTQALSPTQKADVQLDWFSKQLESDGEPLDDDQALAKSIEGEQFGLTVGGNVGVANILDDPSTILP